MNAAGLTLMLEREVRRLDRSGGRRRVVRVFSLLLFSLFLWGAHGMGPFVPFLALITAQMILLLVMQPVRAAGIMVQARQEGTLPLLGVTPLRAWALHAGTIGAALALAAENMLVALPLVCIAAAYGGLTPGVVASAYTMLAISTVLGSCIGAAVGARHGTGAFLRSLSWTLLYFLLPTVLSGILRSAGYPSPSQFIDSLQLAVIMTAPDVLGTLLPIVFNLAVCGALFALGVRRLKRTVLSGADEVSNRAKRKPRTVPERRVVAWRERHRPSPKRWIRPGFIAVTLIVVLFGMQTSGLLTMGQTKAAAGSVFMLGWILWLLMLGWGYLSGARSYAEDWEDGSLVLLLTIISKRRIVGEKLLGALQRGRWGLLGGTLLHSVGLIGYLLIDDWSRGLGVAALTIGAIVLLWVGGAVHALTLGQLFSISAPSSARAQAWAAATAALVFFVGCVATCMIFLPMIVWSEGAIEMLIFYSALGAGLQIPSAFMLFLIRRSLGRGLRAHPPAPSAPSPAEGSIAVRDGP